MKSMEGLINGQPVEPLEDVKAKTEVTTWDVMLFVIGTLVGLSLSVLHPLSLGVCIVACKPEGSGPLRMWLLIINPFPSGL